MSGEGLASRKWELTYRTSDLREDGSPVNILQDFYIPALSLSSRYDRVAGYFRSTSLAAASAGYSAFIQRQGKMRLIVGADLDARDVAAILAGDQQRLENCLMRELDIDAHLPTDVRNGLTLLSWMVAKGILDIRVAFRRHLMTGKPISFDSEEDGYVHEKWLIFTDELGQRLYGSGSLNESRTALVHNAENIDLHAEWAGGNDRRRVEKASLDFEELWNNRRAHIPVMTLPEAVKQRLVQLSQEAKRLFEIDGTPAIDPAITQPSAMEALRFAVLRDAPLMPGGQFVGMYTAPVTPWPHQEIVSRRMIETYPYSYLLCDEVGLGKTIEAGLAIRSLYLAGMVHRVLIAAPASLTHQWQREMMYKAIMPFARTTPYSTGVRRNYLDESIPEPPSTGLFTPDLNIISTGILSRAERRTAIRQAEPFDIVLIDEAHYARRKNSAKGSKAWPEYGHLYTTIAGDLVDKADAFYLATATPMQLDQVEVYDLVKLTKRIGPYRYDPSLMEEYFSILGRLVNRGQINTDEWELISRTFKQLVLQDPYHDQFIKQAALNGPARNLMEDLFRGRRHLPQSDWSYLAKPLFTASPLSRVMQRHSRELLRIYRDRGELNQKLAERTVQPLRKIRFTRAERKSYEQLKEYCDGLTEQINRYTDSQTRQVMFFLLSFLRLRFASSLYAIDQTLRRRRERVRMTLQTGAQQFENEAALAEFLADLQTDDEDQTNEDDIDFKLLLKNRSIPDLEWEEQRLNQMISDLDGLNERPSKMQALLEVIDKRPVQGQAGRVKQMVVFTRFTDTLRDIRKNLQLVNPHFRIGTYSGTELQYYDERTGHLRGSNAEEVKRRFIAGDIDILLCTDAAAEGLNLQTADLIVNYDMGWNPMKIEQRIGRIDRIGQKHDRIYVLNYVYLGSSEEIVYGRLLDRLREAMLVVGTQQISMLPVEAEDFRKLEDGKITEEQLAEEAKKRIKAQKERQASMEIRAQDQYDMYKAMSLTASQQPMPITLDQMWGVLTQSEVLKSYGISADPRQHETLLINNLAGFSVTTRATVSRELFERLEDTRFITYGEPLLESLVDLVLPSDFEMPNCIKRVEVFVADFPRKANIGYVVACKVGNETKLKLITSMSQLDGIEIDKSATIGEDELGPFLVRLRNMAEQAIGQNRQASKVAGSNEAAAKAHLKLLNQIALSLLERESPTGEDRFWQTQTELLSQAAPAATVSIPLKVDSLRHEQEYHLFDLAIPPLGDDHVIAVPAALAILSLEHAGRLAESLRRRRADLTVSEVLRKLRAETT